MIIYVLNVAFCQMHSNGCFPLTFYFSLTFIKTSGSLEPTMCTCAAITWSTNVGPEMVHSEQFESYRLWRCTSVWGQGCSHHVKLRPCLHYAHKFWDSASWCLFIVRCFPNCEQLISISFLINASSPLFNHTAYRHVLESKQEKKKTHKKRLFFPPSSALNGRWLLILVTMQLQLGRSFLTDISAHMILIIVWI